MVRFAAAILAFAALASPVIAQVVHTPPAGSAERRAILDTVRAPLIEHVGGQVEFVVEELRVGGGWAWLQAHPQRPGGADIPPDEFIEDNTTYAMLRQENGGWVIDNWTYGSSDAWWVFYCDKPGRVVVADSC